MMKADNIPFIPNSNTNTTNDDNDIDDNDNDTDIVDIFTELLTINPTDDALPILN